MAEEKKSNIMKAMVFKKISRRAKINILLAAGGILMGIIIGLFIILGSPAKQPVIKENARPTGTTENTGQNLETKPTADINNTGISKSPVDITGEPRTGNESANVIFVEFADYQCKFCHDYFKESFKKIKENYIDTGKILYVYKDFPLNVHPQALPAAVAANCTDKQGKYWEMHDKLYSTQEDWTYINEPESIFRDYAKQFELNMSDYDNCVKDEEILQEISADAAEGEKLGIEKVPTIYINDKKVVGAQPYEIFKNIIERELSVPTSQPDKEG